MANISSLPNINSGSGILFTQELDNNISISADKSFIANLPMPANSYSDLTLGTTESTHTAPANGYFALNKITGAPNQYIALSSSASGLQDIRNGAVAGNWLTVCMPAKKGDVITCTYNASGETNYFRFIYAEGEV